MVYPLRCSPSLLSRSSSSCCWFGVSRGSCPRLLGRPRLSQWRPWGLRPGCPPGWPGATPSRRGGPRPGAWGDPLPEGVCDPVIQGDVQGQRTSAGSPPICVPLWGATGGSVCDPLRGGDQGPDCQTEAARLSPCTPNLAVGRISALSKELIKLECQPGDALLPRPYPCLHRSKYPLRRGWPATCTSSCARTGRASRRASKP